MNKKKRAKLDKASSLLGEARDIVGSVRDDEQYDLGNIPENLQDSERYSAMEDAVDALDEAIDNIEQAQKNIEQACQ